MKTIKILTIVFVAVFVCGYAIAFTSFGNSILASYAAKKIKQESGLDVSFSEFELRPSSIKLSANANEEIFLNIDGDLSIFTQSFDLTYSISAKSLKTLQRNLRQVIEITGQAKGKIKDFAINGTAKGLGSNLSFLAELNQLNLAMLKLDARDIQIQDLLALGLKPPYISGTFDMFANIAQNGQNKPSGPATITIKQANTNNALILKDFDIALPKGLSINGQIKAQLDGALINASTDLNSQIASINAKHTLYDIEQDLLSTDLQVAIPDLSKLETITKQKLNGALSLSSTISLKNKQLNQLNANLSGLGGNIIANLNGGTLNAKIENVQIQKALALAAQSPLAKGAINAVAQLQNITSGNISGRIFAKSEGGTLLKSELNKLGANVLKDIDFSIDLDTNLKDNVADFSANLKSGLINLSEAKGRYDLRAKALKSNFKLSSSDNSQFKAILAKELNSQIDLNAELIANGDKISSLKLDGKALGGDIAAKFDGKSLNGKASELNLKDIFLLAGKSPLLNAKMALEMNLKGFDLSSIDGNAKLALKQGTIYKKELANLLDKQVQNDINFNANINSKIESGKAKFNGQVSSSIANIDNLTGDYDIKSGAYGATFDIFVSDLSKLAFITQRELRGDIKAKVDISGANDALNLKLNSDIFGGKLDANLKNDIFDANITKFKVQDMLKMADMQQFYEGIADGTIKYNLKNQKGDFNFLLNDGQLKNTNLIKFVSAAVQKDLSQEVFNDGFIKGNINKSLIKFDASLKSSSASLAANKSSYDTNTKALNIPLDIKIQKTDLNVNISGTSDNPKYSLSSEYLKKKAGNAIEKLIDKNVKGSEKDAIKGLLKGLF